MIFDVKKIVHFLSGSLLRFLVYFTATSTVFLLIGGSSGHIKQAIEKSGAYERFVPSIIESNADNKGASSIPLDDPEVVKIINDAFPPQDLRNKTNAIIDSVFAWLQGKSEQPSFTVDFTNNKDQLGDKLSEYAFTNLAFKDTCKVQPQTFDPFNADCRPDRYNIFEGQAEFATQIKSSEGFLGHTILTDQDLPKNKQGKNIFEQYSYAPQVYVWLKRAPPILGAATILAACGYIWSDVSKRRGVMRLGRGVVGNSLTLIVTPFIFGFIVPWVTKTYSGDLSGSSAEVLLNDIITTVSKDFNTLMIWFGSVLLLVGLMIIVAEKMTRARAKYSGVEKKSGLLSSNEPVSVLASPRGKLTAETLPLQSSESSKSKKPKAPKKDSKYRKIPL